MSESRPRARRRPRPFSPDLAEPPAVLYRIGRRPDPLVLPPWDAIGQERFDDPLGQFRVLYTAEQRLACFLETLASLRPPLTEQVAALRPFWGGRLPPLLGRIPPDWHLKRCVGRLALAPGQRWLDLRSLRTTLILRDELASLLVELGLRDLDVSGVRGPSRRLTQAIGRWAYERGYGGIAYKSRFDDALSCWAVFDRATWTPSGPPEPIRRSDPDLRAAARLFGLIHARPS